MLLSRAIYLQSISSAKKQQLVLSALFHQGEMRKIDECDMEKFGTLGSREKTIAILGDGW